MDTINKYLPYGVCAFAAICLLWATAKYSKNNLKFGKKRKPVRRSLEELQTTKEWTKVGKVKKLWLYPVKSCAGINVDKMQTGKFAPRVGNCHDRSFLIIDEKNVLVTARRITSTLSIKVSYDGGDPDSITLRAPTLPPLTLRYSTIETLGSVVRTQIEGEDVCGLDCGATAGEWVSSVLGRGNCRILFHGSPQSSARSTAKFVAQYPLMNSDDNSLFADTGCLMVMSEASIHDLSKKTGGTQWPHENFRPNVLIEGVAAPYDEDSWGYLKIGDAIMRCGMPCQRCIFPTINFKTGKRDPNMEPLRTLKKYRCSQGETSPDFGLLMGIDKQGQIAQGDDVYVIKS